MLSVMIQELVMPPNPYQRALNRRDELRKELAEITEFIRLWGKYGGSESSTEGERTPPMEGVAPVTALTPPLTLTSPPQDAIRSPTRELAKKIARAAILKAGRPLTRSRLVAAFAEAGEPVGGQDPNKNMGTIMWRLQTDFVNLPGAGYWPRDVSYPLLDYVPESGNKETQ